MRSRVQTRRSGVTKIHEKTSSRLPIHIGSLFFCAPTLTFPPPSLPVTPRPIPENSRISPVFPVLIPVTRLKPYKKRPRGLPLFFVTPIYPFAAENQKTKRRGENGVYGCLIRYQRGTKILVLSSFSQIISNYASQDRSPIA